MIPKIKRSMKTINYKLFAALLLLGLIPTIYTTVRIFFLGQMPDSWGFNIASQLAWLNIVYEVIQEALILPLFYFIGKAFMVGKDDLENKVRTGLVFTFVIYSALSALIITFAVPIINFMAQDSSLLAATTTYIRLETVANVFATLVKFLLVVLVTIKKDKYLYMLLGLKMVLSIVLDTFFVSSLPISLNFGVNGIAYTNIIVNIFIIFLSLWILKKEQINIFAKKKLCFKWIKDWTKIGGISGLESLVRNFAFAVMILRMVNVVGEQGTFWVANNFIWGWLLLPVLQLGELVKRDTGENIDAIREKTLGYFAITTIIVIIWFASIPLWKPFLEHVMNVSNYRDVYFVVIISIGFYVLFAYNNVIDSIFYGIGKTSYMLFQSLVVNSLFYGTAFILYITGIYEPTLTKIALMFALGIAMDCILTYGMFVWMLKKRNIKIL